LRTIDDPLQHATQVREVIRTLDPNLAVSNIKTLDTLVDESVAGRRFYTLLLGAFAAVALLLAGVGIFGVISIMVAQRRSEIGVRMALGAAPGSVLRLIVGGALKLAGVGVVIGLVAALAATRLLSSLLFEVGSTDPVTFAGTAVMLLAVAGIAAALPARSAASVDPNVALRVE
jgi:putative ABC transport system permease protein